MHTRTTLIAVSLSFGAVCQAVAGPKGGIVVGGRGTISTPNANTTVINQTSNQLNLNWSSFNVASNESVLFHQPTSTSVAFNRILDQSPSQIFGHIQGNGQVVLVNPNGFLIGRTATLNVNSLVVSSLDAIDFDASSGRYRFSSVSNPGAVINQGTITAARGGSVTLLGGQVGNSGSIVADFGTVNLAAGRKATLDLAGDGLLRLEVDSQLLTNRGGAASAVENTGTIQANGGRVLLTASAMNDVFANLVNNSGVLRANRIDNTGGTIELLGPGGEVVSSGTLDASAGDSAGTGGTVEVLGKYVGLFDDATVDVSGKTGGGTALIGGDYHGANPGVLNAEQTFVSSGATISADAGTTGNGGHVVVWSDDLTRLAGNIQARGGTASGDGGYVEVSGKQSLNFTGNADLTAAHGATGTILLDPAYITIDNMNGDPYPGQHTVIFSQDQSDPVTIGASTVQNLLETGDVVLQATIDLNQTASITANDAPHMLTLQSHGTMELVGITTIGGLTLSANGTLSLNGAVSTGALGFTVNPDGPGASGLQMGGSSSITANGGNVSITVPGAISLGPIQANQISVTSTASDITNFSGSSLQAGSVSLSASGNVGASGHEILTQTGSLGASATHGDVYITNTGNVVLGFVAAANTVQLTSSGNITGGSVHGQDMTLVAASGIGTSSNPVSTFVSSIAAQTDTGDVYINQSGAASLLSVSASGNGATIDIKGGASDVFTVGSVSAHNHGTVILNAASIADDGSQSSYIDGGVVQLTSQNDIGGSGTNQQIDLTGGAFFGKSNAGGVYMRSGSTVTLGNVTAGGPVNIATDAGDIITGTVSSPSNVALNAHGSIAYGGGLITAASLNLTAGTGIGQQFNALRTATANSASVMALSANTTSGDIEVTHQGNLFVNNASTAGAAAKVGISTGTSGELLVLSVDDHVGGTVSLTGTDIVGAGGNLIQAPFVNLTATGSSSGVGASGGAINLVGGSALTASANVGGVFVHSPGALTLDSVQSSAGSISAVADNGSISAHIVSAPTSVVLNAINGGIGVTGGNPLISTNALTLTAANSIGTQSSTMRTATNSLAATITGAGSIYLTNQGDLNLGSAVAAGSGSNVVISASGAIAGSGASNIQGAALFLTAGTSIGSAAANSQIATNVGSITAEADGGGIYLAPVGPTTITSAKATSGTSDISIDSAGDMTVGVVNASGNVALTSDFGSIIGTGGTLVTGKMLTLNAGGSIGGGSQPFETAVDSLVAYSRNSGISVENSRALTVTTADAQGSFGNIDVTSLTGDLTVGAVSAPGSVALTAKTGSIVDDGNSGTGIYGLASVNLQAAHTIGSVLDFPTLAGTPVQVFTNGGFFASAKDNSGQINLSLSGAFGISPGGISLGSGSGIRSGVVLLQAPGDLNVANLAPGAISIGTGNTAKVGLSAGGMGIGAAGTLTLPSTAVFTDAPAYSLLVHGATDIVDTDQAPRELAINASTLNFLSGSAGGASTLDTQVSRLDATIGNGQSLTVNQTGSLTLGAISVVGGGLQVTANGGSLNGDGVTSSPQLVASAITLRGTSLGAGNAIYTQADTLNAAATAGAIHIREADAVTLAANATGGVVDVQTANGVLTVAQASGVGVSLTSQGLIVDGAISGGGADVYLTSSGDIGLNGVVSSPAATVNLTANSGLIAANSGNGITANSLIATGLSVGADGARINTAINGLNATATGPGGVFVTNSGPLSMTASAVGGRVDVQNTGAMTVASAAGNGVSLTVNGDGNFLTLAGGAVDGRAGDVALATTGANSQININNTVSTSGNVMLNAGPGAIRLNGGHISGNVLTANGGSIGTSSAPLKTAVTSLNATSTNGDIYVQEDDALQLNAAATGGALQVSTGNGALTVISASGNGADLTAGGAGSNLNLNGAVNAGSGQARLTAAGAIVADPGNLLSGSSGTLRAASVGSSGARLNTLLDSLDVATTAGGIFVSEGDGLVLTATASGGPVDLQTLNGGLTITSATGDGLELGAGGTGSVLTVSGGLQGRSGNVDLTADGGVAFNGNVATTGGLTVTTSGVVAGPGSLAGGTISLTGTAIGGSTARINTATSSLMTTSTNGGIFINGSVAFALNGSATGGALDVVSGGALTVNSASGSGVMLSTTSAGSSINLNGLVDGGTGAISLVTPGAITSGVAARVSGVSLTATGSAIGSAASHLETSVSFLNTTSTNGGTFVDQAGAVALSANATGGEVNVQTTNGSLIVSGASGAGVSLVAGGPNNSITLNGLVAGGTGGVTLIAGTSASGGVIIAGSGASITGSKLTASGAAIGTGDIPLSTNIDTLNATATRGGVYISEKNGLTLESVQSGGDVIVSTRSGNITVDSVSAANNVTLTAASGSISDDGVESTGLTAHTVNLLAQSIGSSSTAKQRLGIAANTLNATSTNGGVYIDAQNGLAGVSVQANGGVNGNIELMAPNGDLNLLSVSASNTLLLSAGGNILGLPGLGHITARSAELRAGASDPATGHIGTPIAPLSLQLDPGNSLRIFVPQTVSSSDPTRAPATLPSTGVLTTLSLFNAPSALALDAGYGQFQGLSDSLYTSQAESLVHTIQNQTVVQTVVGLDWGALDPNVSLFGTLDPSVCLPGDQRDEEAGGAGC